MLEALSDNSSTPEPLPPLYGGWLTELLGASIPRESRATCSNCPMCQVEGRDSLAAPFRPDVKCCTYVPELQNYLAGQILLDSGVDTAFGRASLLRRIAARVGVTPRSVDVPPIYAQLYAASSKLAFGRAPRLRCPHFDEDNGGRCSIWQYRNSVCTTWFCRYVRGPLGHEFWNQVKQLLMAIEVQLATWAVVELFPSSAMLQSALEPRNRVGPERLVEELSGIDENESHSMWGRWWGREVDFYQACAQLVSALDWSDVLRISGAEVAGRARVVHSLFQRMWQAAPPLRLTVSPALTESVVGGAVTVAVHSAMDPIVISSAVYTVLDRFDGRPVEEVMLEINETTDAKIDEATVRSLLDYGVLQAVAPESIAT